MATSRGLYKAYIFRNFSMLSTLLGILWSTVSVLGLENDAMRCFCSEHCPEFAPNNTCFLRPGGWCFTQIQAGEDGVEHEDKSPIVSHGCLPPELEGGYMMCQSEDSPHSVPRSIICCNDAPLCNLNLMPTLPPTTTANSPDDAPPGVYTYDTTIHQVVLLISVTVCAVVFILVMTFFYLRYKKREATRRYALESVQTDESYISPGQTLRELIENSQTSGSGSGLPLLVQRTIAKQVQLIRSIGKGRYGETWKAKWRGEYVAVKIYFTSEEASWFRETEIYQTVLMRHENILGFIAADIRGSGSWTQNFLITEYHEHGSLRDYLRTNILDQRAMLQLAFTASNGLAHLHTEICGMQGKPAIAHGDIKSSNILIKKNGTCALGDMAMATRFLSDTNEINTASHAQRVGTKRYMAPEHLDGSMNRDSFEAYKMTDIYSFGLVLWEIARRCFARGIVEDAELAYFDCVSNEPSFDEMRRVVATERRRPDIPNRWSGDDCLRTMAKLMSECWNPNPAARLTALRVKKTIAKMQENEFKV